MFLDPTNRALQKEPFIKRSCGRCILRWHIEIAGVKKRSLLLYLSCTLIFIKLVANVPQAAHEPELNEKIVAFKREGVEKKINTAHYDVEGIIQYAESLLRTPYTMGGYSSSGLDCSGLVKMAHAQFDIALPHSSHEQARYGTIILPDEELKRGDLVFFHSTYATANLITHSGIYLGENKFIHTSTSRGVSISALLDSGYWQDHYLFATRLND
jgi:cell wall-associated NlpC family hydrolase